ncbi:MAG: penicillin-binding protein 1C, partial [Candidatus Binatia bacterium]
MKQWINRQKRLGAGFLLSLLCMIVLFWLPHAPPDPVVPSFQDVRTAYRPSDIPLLDRSGAVIHELRLDATRRRLAWTPLSEISPALQAAVIASEDRRFYQHGGVDGRALIAAMLQRLVGGHSRGASTLSMQVATLLPPDLRSRRGLKRKWRQMRLAWALEQHWSKIEIFEAYLNLVPFRGEREGITAAASFLFDKAPHGITEAEALVLAVLLRAPNARQEAVARRAWVLREAQKGTATRQEVMTAIALALNSPPGTGPRRMLAPHLAHRLLRSTPSFVPVRSTLDGALQRVVVETLRHHLLAVRARHVKDGAVLVVDNATGEVLAYVGGSGDLSSAPYVDGVRARRQAGSTLKPFLYGLAFAQRFLTPASLLEDGPLNLAVAGGLYRPQNYDEHFRGLVTVRTALAASLNVPAVRALELVGAEPFGQQLRRRGCAGRVESGDYYGPSLALGSVDVSLWELVNAYRTLANGGVPGPLRMRGEEVPSSKPVLSVVEGFRVPSQEESELRTPDSGVGNPQSVYSEATTFLVSHILADRESRSATFGLENPLATRFWSAVKTGTSKDMHDNWCVGYSRRYTVGVWVGNFSGEPMHDVSGVTGAAPVWLEVMSWLHRATPSVSPTPPSGVLAKTITFPREIEPQRREWFLTGTEPPSSTQILAEGHPRILTPVSGTVIALDPDIPPARQQILCEAQTTGLRLRWVLDGADMGIATTQLLWHPLPGQHTLSLVDEARRPLDTVTFQVRGSPAPVD